jgi:hypothetical protein
MNCYNYDSTDEDYEDWIARNNNSSTRDNQDQQNVEIIYEFSNYITF